MHSAADERRLRGHVLLVDDDERIRDVYAELLQSLHCSVEVAADGRDATRKLDGVSFDLILSDIGMPNLSGTELLRRVRERDLDVPVVLMTGAPSLESAVQAVEYGAFRYLPKPLSLSTLRAVVHKALHMHRLAKLKREALKLAESSETTLDDGLSLNARFNLALDKLWMAYQPIVHWPDRKTFAYEALLRSSDASLRSPLRILDAAERLGRLFDLGRRIREVIVESAPLAPEEALFFVNLHAADLNDGELFSSSSPLTPLASRVVLEITERASLQGVHDLSRKVRRLRDLGFRIAVDDLGAGYAGLSSFAQLEPEFVKLDMSLVRGVDVSSKKRSVVRAMSELCRKDLLVEVISEGIETETERDVLASEGCELLQGYLFAKPHPEFRAPVW